MDPRGSSLRRHDGGQAVVLVAIAIAALLGAVALAMDWGYGLTQRRVAQNEADAGAIAVGKSLATSVVLVNGAITFGLSQEDAWCVAQRYAMDNDALAARNGTDSLSIQFGDAMTPITWTAPISSVASCTAPATFTAIPGSTRYVRVEAGIVYPTLFGAITGAASVEARASARAQLSGSPVPLSGPVWPMVRHYNPDDYNIQQACPPNNCDPTKVDPITFWSPNTDEAVYGNFKGMVDLSRYSTRYWPARAEQLEDRWDATGSAQATPPTAPLADHSGNCAGGWDTAGNESVSNQDKQCSIPNWFYYAFQGGLSLSSTWDGVGELPAGQEIPGPIDARPAICTDQPMERPSPSCEHPNEGDWVETAYGNVGQNESDNMLARIRAQGHVTPMSDVKVATGPNKGNAYGKALTILVYLWDCAESFNSSAPAGQQWDLIYSRGSSDCSQIQANGNTKTPDRVHLFTAAPFTFYEGLVTSQAIQGYWGGMMGDARECQDCDLNPLANTAFLVPDE